jgi:AMP phosphorylase
MNETVDIIELIQNKFDGKRFSYQEIYSLMDQISYTRFHQRNTSNFTPAGQVKGFTNEEIYYLIKKLTQSRAKLHFPGVAADVTCMEDAVGAVVPLIVVPIVAAAGFKVPKHESSINLSMGGTADIMEVLAPVRFARGHIAQVVGKAGGCIVREEDEFVPAADILNNNETFLPASQTEKMLVSLVAHNVSSGVNHLVVDLPYGEYGRFGDLPAAEKFKHALISLAEQFHIQTHVSIHKAPEIAGFGIGPALAARDVMRILEQADLRSSELEKHAVTLAGTLLDLCLGDPHTHMSLKKRINVEFGAGIKWAAYILRSGHALNTMKEIIKTQGGDPKISSGELKPGKFSFDILAEHNTTLTGINTRNAFIIAKILGAPRYKKSGIYVYHKKGDNIQQGTILATLYSEHEYNLSEAKDSLRNFPIYS